MPNTYALALHTTTSELGLALSNFDGDSRQQTWDVGRSLSTHLHVYLKEFLHPQTWTDLEFMAVAIGPGSFTSTRIGVVTARTLAQQLNIPLFAVSTLATVAWSTHTLSGEKPIGFCPEAVYVAHGSGDANPDLVQLAVQLPAQRGDVFAGIYEIIPLPALNTLGLTALLPDAVFSQEQWQQILQTWNRAYNLTIAEEPLGWSVMSLLELAYRDWQQGQRPDWSTALPFYGQSCV